MSRFNTTIWDLANAIVEASEAEGVDAPEAEALAAIALIDSLDRAILVDLPEHFERRPQQISQRPAAIAV